MKSVIARHYAEAYRKRRSEGEDRNEWKLRLYTRNEKKDFGRPARRDRNGRVSNYGSGSKGSGPDEDDSHTVDWDGEWTGWGEGEGGEFERPRSANVRIAQARGRQPWFRNNGSWELVTAPPPPRKRERKGEMGQPSNATTHKARPLALLFLVMAACDNRGRGLARQCLNPQDKRRLHFLNKYRRIVEKSFENMTGFSCVARNPTTAASRVCGMCVAIHRVECSAPEGSCPLPTNQPLIVETQAVVEPITAEGEGPGLAQRSEMPTKNRSAKGRGKLAYSRLRLIADANERGDREVMSKMAARNKSEQLRRRRERLADMNRNLDEIRSDADVDEKPEEDDWLEGKTKMDSDSFWGRMWLGLTRCCRCQE